MSKIIRCSCGLVVAASHAVPPQRRLCSHCGQLLPLPEFSAEPASNPQDGKVADTVRLQPFYALDEPTTFGYRVVEIKENAATEVSQPVPAQPTYPVAKAPEPSRWSDNDVGDLDVRAMLAKARRAMRDERRRRPQAWRLEQSGWNCCRYPLRIWWKIARLALVWTFTMLVLTNLLEGPAGPGVWLARVPMLIIPLYLVGVTWCFLRQVLRLAVVGDNKRAPIPTYWDAPVIVHCALIAGGAFLAGPALLLAASVWFWVNAGTLEWVDRLLLWQLWLAAGVGWAYLLLAVDARGRLRDAHAAAVAPLVRREGWSAFVFPILGGLSVTLFVHLSVQIWMMSFHDGFKAFLLQFFLWCVALCLWTFLLRWYGMTRYWRRQAARSGDFERAPA
jgi:hypothetical protein